MIESFSRQEFFEGERRKFKALYQEKVLLLKGGTEKVYLLRPQTYMNLSGHAVRDFLGFFGVDTTETLVDTLLVVHDDLDLPAAKLRYRARGATGGHLGVKSIIDCLGHGDFSRLKVGVGRPEGRDDADFVLEKVDVATEEVLQVATQHAARSVSIWLDEGIDVAMNCFNRKESDAESPGE